VKRAVFSLFIASIPSRVWVATVKTLHLKGLGDRVLTLHSEQKQKYEKGN
jgi:hypothetical protein